MGKLSNILAAGGYRGESLQTVWNSTPAADESLPLPTGEYVAMAERGELKSSQHGTPGYSLTFRIVNGEFAGRKLWLDCWLTPAAIPLTKRDLAKLDINDLAQLDDPLPQGYRCRLRVTLRRDDDGTERNRITRFDVLGIDPPTVDPFAPTAAPLPEGGDNVPF
jgi:hypothetical protein